MRQSRSASRSFFSRPQERLAGPGAEGRTDRAGAHKELLAELYPVVRKHVGFVLGFDHLAEDAVQESMIEIHRSLPHFRGESSPRTWALAIATRTARRYRRRERRRAQAAPEPSWDEAVYDLEQTGAAELGFLVKALARLSTRKREAFVLMSIFELSAQEAARVLGTFTNTVASRYRHARRELEEIYRDESR